MRGYIPAETIEENIFVKRCIQLLEKAEKSYNAQFSLFLDLRKQELFLAQGNKFSSLHLEKIYGYHSADSERCLIKVSSNTDELDTENIPILVLKSKVLDNEITHRDVLGALMKLQISRDYIGDILVFDNTIFIICHNVISEVILQELHVIKKSNVSFSVFTDSLFFERPEKERQIATVASLRADSIMASLLKISRSDAAKMIKQGLVQINHRVIQNKDSELFDQDVISVKYQGKFKLYCTGNKSRKDRIFISYIKY